MSTALKMTRARDQIDGLRLQLQLQEEVARAVTAQAADLETLLAPVARVIAKLLDADAVAIWTTDHRTNELQLAAVSQLSGGPAPRSEVAIGDAYVIALSTAARPSVFIDPPFDQPLFNPDLSGSRRRISVCPLVLDGNRLVGVLGLARSTELDGSEEDAFASVADQVALAIEKEHAVRRVREREDGLDILICTAPDGIVVMDARSRILASNPSLDRTFGYDPGELVGQEVTVIMPERFRARHAAGIRRYQETGVKRTSWKGIELVGLRKDGTEFPIEISFGEYMHDGRMAFTGFIRDISERKRAEEREQRRRRLIQTTAVYLGSSWVALEAADLLLPVLPVPDWTFRALVLIAVLGFPLALALACKFEFSRNGIRRINAGSAEPSSPLTAPAGIVRTGAAAAVLVVLFMVPMLIGPVGGRGDRAEPAVSIAVLPFQDVSDGDGRTLIGLTDEILTRLASMDGIRVTSRTSVLASVANLKSIAQFARDLDVSYVLEGSVRRSGDDMRITVQLIRAASDEHVWSASYDRDGSDPLKMETDIAREIADQIRTTFQNPQ